AEAALARGLDVILCVGESLQRREQGDAIATVVGELGASLPANARVGKLVIAYEPIWAIGTGKVPTNDVIGEMHGAIRKHLDERYGEPGSAVRILYGGSVKA